MAAPLPHPLGLSVCVGGAASAVLLRLGGTPSAPYPTSSIWVCLGSPLLRSLASSPFIRCHGHDQHLEREGEKDRGSLCHQVSEGAGLRALPHACACARAQYPPLILSPHRNPMEASRAPRWGSPAGPPPHFRPEPRPQVAPPPASPPGRALRAGASPKSSLRAAAALGVDEGRRDQLQRGPAPVSETLGECTWDLLSYLGPVCAGLCFPPCPCSRLR